MKIIPIKYGYNNQRLYDQTNKKQTSVQIHTEERKYYIAITIGLVLITSIAIVSSYLMPTVPL